MSFDDVNQAIKNGGGSYAKLSVKGQILEGIVLDVKVQDKVFEGKKVPNATTGEPRKEWLFTLETNEGVKKFSAMEGAQTAVRNALNGVKIEKGGKIRFELTQEFKRGVQYAEYVVEYIAPKFETVDDNEDVPF